MFISHFLQYRLIAYPLPGVLFPLSFLCTFCIVFFVSLNLLIVAFGSITSLQYSCLRSSSTSVNSETQRVRVGVPVRVRVRGVCSVDLCQCVCSK
jgi:hypothetical protein